MKFPEAWGLGAYCQLGRGFGNPLLSRARTGQALGDRLEASEVQR